MLKNVFSDSFRIFFQISVETYEHQKFYRNCSGKFREFSRNITEELVSGSFSALPQRFLAEVPNKGKLG